ncbi:MAG: nucleoside 2-deoxyribosyltransferase [Clostridia bacterium]|nr:nucleoside 2-deoxyribosyltransferase [Clostridia bacterium]
MKRKVYFAGSIRGGRTDAELYKRMIAFIKTRAEVLTEHVGDLSLSLFEGEPGRDKLIYGQDTAWLRECDLVIAECTCPSLGVGYELCYAEKFNKPCFVFYNKAKGRLSAMIKGDEYFTIVPYKSEEELFERLSEIL